MSTVRTKKIKKIFSEVVFYTILILLLLIWLFPFFWMVFTSIKPAELTFALPPRFLFEPTLAHYLKVFSETPLLRNTFNSFLIAAAEAVICSLFGAMAAYSIARFKVDGKWMQMAILGVRMIPPAVLALPLFVMFNGWNMVDNQVSIILAHATFTLPFAIWLLIGFIQDIPMEIEEAALVDGCTPLTSLIRVIIPLIKPGLAVAAFFSFIFSWNEFLYALVLSIDSAQTLPIIAAGFITNQAIMWGPVAAIGTLMVVPPVVFVALTHKHIVRGLTLGGIK
jgi:multiple sugar transport system permease protein